MKVTLLACTPGGDKLAGEAAATCYRAKDPEKSLGLTLKSGHESVIEHVSFTFRLEGVSRALLAQLTRHRIASFSVESQRYCDLGEMPLVIPESIRRDENMMIAWEAVAQKIRWFYRYAVDNGVPKEDARYMTPQAAETTIVVTMNARELKHFFSLRCCNRAQWEIRQAADEMLKICKEKCPVIFKNAGPGCVNGRCEEGRPCGKPRNGESLFGKDG